MSLNLARAKQVAQHGVWSVLADLMMEGKYGQLEIVKPDNTIRIMFENFSSLHLFVLGKEKGIQIWQINKLMKEYNVNIMDGCKTRVDWRFTNPQKWVQLSICPRATETGHLCTHFKQIPTSRSVGRDVYGGS
jgi:hypothetical protein